MLAFLWSIIRDTFEKFNCKLCKNIKSIFAVRMLWHLYKKHGLKPTKKDIKFLLRYNLLSRLLLSAVAVALFVPLFVIKIVLIPFYYFYEFV